MPNVWTIAYEARHMCKVSAVQIGSAAALRSPSVCTCHVHVKYRNCSNHRASGLLDCMTKTSSTNVAWSRFHSCRVRSCCVHSSERLMRAPHLLPALADQAAQLRRRVTCDRWPLRIDRHALDDLQVERHTAFKKRETFSRC